MKKGVRNTILGICIVSLPDPSLARSPVVKFKLQIQKHSSMSYLQNSDLSLSDIIFKLTLFGTRIDIHILKTKLIHTVEEDKDNERSAMLRIDIVHLPHPFLSPSSTYRSLTIDQSISRSLARSLIHRSDIQVSHLCSHWQQAFPRDTHHSKELKKQ